MDKVYEANASATPPAAPAGSTGYPTNGNIGAGVPPTTPGAYWFHMVTAELLAVIVAGAITPAKNTLTQLRDAISNMITAAFNGSGRQSLANPGYQRLPGGYIQQWGVLSAAPASVDTAVTLPVTMDAAYVPTAVVLGSGGGAEVCKVKALTTTTITLTYLGSGTADIAWSVIGKKA